MTENQSESEQISNAAASGRAGGLIGKFQTARRRVQEFQKQVSPYQNTINKVRIVLYVIAVPWAIFIAIKSMPYYAAIGKGESYFKQGLYEQAEKEFLFCYEQCKTENVKDPRMVRVLNNLGMVYRGTGRHRLAAPYVKETVEIAEQYFPKRQELPMSLSNEGALLNDLGQYQQAESAYRRAIDTWNANIKKDSDTKLAAIYNGLARSLREQGKFDEAKTAAQKALAIRERETGKDSPECAEVMENLAKILQREGRFDEAQQMLERGLLIDRKAFGEKHPNVASDECTMGRLLMEKGSLSEAKLFLEKSLATRQKVFKPEHPTIAKTLSSLGELSLKQGDTSIAKVQLETALAMQTKCWGAQHPDTLETAAALKIASDSRAADSRKAERQAGK